MVDQDQGNPNQRVAELHGALINAHLDRIKSGYISANFSQKQKILGSLESIACIDFDCDKARKIRLKKKLSQTELGKQTELPQQTLSNYERGISIPSPEGESKEYLKWLKFQGYNPFDI